VGHAGAPISFLLTGTGPFAANAPANTATTDKDFGSFLLLVTDQSTHLTTNSFQLGSDGERDLFEQNSNMLMVYSVGGGPYLYYLNKTAIRAAEAGGTPISPSNPGVTKSQIVGGSISGSPCTSGCTVLNSGGAEVFSRGQAYTIFELWSDGLTIYKDVINPSTDTFTRTLYANLGNAFPKTYFSTWNGEFTTATDGSVALAMAGGMDWKGSTAYVTGDYTSFIYPQTGNSANHAFQATVGGTTSGTEPTWSTCTSTCTDGGVTWTNIGSVNGQGPGFDAVVYLAGTGYYALNTRLGQVRSGTTVAGTWTTTDTVICGKYGTNPCPLTDLMTLHGNGADLNSAYMSLTPTHGGGTPVLTPGTANCLNTNATYYGAYSAGKTYSKTSPAHQTVYDPSHGAPYSYYEYVYATPTAGNAPPNSTYWQLADVYCYTYTWQVATLNINVSTQTSGASHTSGHQAQGYLNYWADNDQYQHLFSQPMVYQSVSGTIDEVPYPTIGGSGSTGWLSRDILPNGFPSDHHDSYRDSGLTDTPPIVDFATQVPTISNGALTGLAYYGEVVGECTGLGTCPLGTTYRFSHIYNTGMNQSFEAQNNIGNASQDGQWALVGTDMMGTRGSTSPAWAGSAAYALGATMYPTSNNAGKYDFQVIAAGTTSGTQPDWDAACATSCVDGGVTWKNLKASCDQLRAGFSPSASTAFSGGSAVYPVSNNPNNDVYLTAAGGTTGATVPNWQVFCPSYGNCPSLDGTVQWTNEGPNDCRSDAMLIDLMSAAPLTGGPLAPTGLSVTVH
jgi:hypothetical protein